MPLPLGVCPSLNRPLQRITVRTFLDGKEVSEPTQINALVFHDRGQKCTKFEGDIVRLDNHMQIRKKGVTMPDGSTRTFVAA